jgi:hypothetical protein
MTLMDPSGIAAIPGLVTVRGNLTLAEQVKSSDMLIGAALRKGREAAQRDVTMNQKIRDLENRLAKLEQVVVGTQDVIDVTAVPSE